jgi:hypothetical protein
MQLKPYVARVVLIFIIVSGNKKNRHFSLNAVQAIVSGDRITKNTYSKAFEAMCEKKINAKIVNSFFAHLVHNLHKCSKSHKIIAPFFKRFSS